MKPSVYFCATVKSRYKIINMIIIIIIIIISLLLCTCNLITCPPLHRSLYACHVWIFKNKHIWVVRNGRSVDDCAAVGMVGGSVKVQVPTPIITWHTEYTRTHTHIHILRVS